MASEPNDHVDVLVTAIDAGGNLLWTREIENPAVHARQPHIALLPDNRLLVVIEDSVHSVATAVTLNIDGDAVDQQDLGYVGWPMDGHTLTRLDDQVLYVNGAKMVSFAGDGSVQWTQALGKSDSCGAPKSDGIACFYPYPNQNGLYDLAWYDVDGNLLQTAEVPWQPVDVVSNGSGKWVFQERFIPDDNPDKRVLSQFFDRFHVLSAAGVEQDRIIAEPGFGMSTGASEAEYWWQTFEVADMIEYFDAQGSRLVVAGSRGGPADSLLRDNRIFVGEFSLD